MASFSTRMLPFVSFSLVIFSTLISNNEGGFSEEITEAITLNRMEKTTHLHFYFQDIRGGQAPTARKIAGPESGGGFGDTYIMDDALTEEPERKSKIVGRAQGVYALASQDFRSLLMVVNYAFNEGKYNGSVISILGRNPVFDEVREMPIVGGTGLFRYARGYALAHTVRYDPKTGDATVEYNVRVLHY